MQLLKITPYLFGLTIITVLYSSPVQSVESATCVYTDPPSMQFMQNWLLCGSFPVQSATPEANMERKRNSRGVEALDDAVYRAAFDFDYLEPVGGEKFIRPSEGMTFSLNGETYEWKYYDDVGKVYDLRRLFNPSEDVVAYAYAEIESTEAKNIMLSLGSDDGIKVWLNGDTIHEVFTGRPLQVDQDAVELNLKQGVNRLLLKIQNLTLDYAFACRLIAMDDYKTFQFKKRNNNVFQYFGNLFKGFFEKD